MRPSSNDGAPRGPLVGAMFLMATSAIGPGFITQTTQFTAQLGAAFAFAIRVASAGSIPLRQFRYVNSATSIPLRQFRWVDSDTSIPLGQRHPVYAKMPVATLPWTSVSRKSRPA